MGFHAYQSKNILKVAIRCAGSAALSHWQQSRSTSFMRTCTSFMRTSCARTFRTRSLIYVGLSPFSGTELLPDTKFLFTSSYFLLLTHLFFQARELCHHIAYATCRPVVCNYNRNVLFFSSLFMHVYKVYSAKVIGVLTHRSDGAGGI